MKITPQDYQELKALILPLAPKIAAHRAALKNDTRISDPEKRLRWDCFWAAKPQNWADKVYKYANDNHIDSALKRILIDIELNVG